MHYVELDVNNLRRWLAGQLAAAGGVNGVNAKNDNGYILYFSDRRGKNAGAPAEIAGEFGYEDNVNPATSGGAPNSGSRCGRGCERRRYARRLRSHGAQRCRLPA